MRTIMMFLLAILLLGFHHVLPAQDGYIFPSTTTIGPGVIHKHMVDKQAPLNIHVVEIDLSNPYISMETVKAQDAYSGYERTSSMSSRKNHIGHWSVAGVNGDFYATGGIPINSQVINGELLRTVGYNNKSTLGFDAANRPVISITNFSGKLILKNAGRAISGVNQDRQTNFLVVYNPFWGNHTDTNEWGTEVEITPLTDWTVNDTIVCVAGDIARLVGKMPIPAGKAVLSGHQEASDFLYNNIQSGDTLKLVLELQPALANIKQLIGGFPKIVSEGVNYVDQGYAQEDGPPHTYQRHPRTAVGFSADSTRLYFITVDGRQDLLSRGMTLPELADFMISIGVAHGINLDGGGSTTMVVRNQVKNSPSDGSERSVANSLLAVSSAPQGTLHYVQMEPDNQRLFLNESITFKTSGWDEYYNPVSLNTANLTWQVDPALGTVSADGYFTATANGGQGYVYALYDGIKDSAYVHIVRIKQIVLAPQITVTDTLRTLQFRVRAIDEDDGEPELAGTVYQWQSLNPQVGEVDSTGLFRARQAGTTQVVVQYAELSDTAEVHVEIGSGQMLLDSLDTGMNWELGGEYIDSLATVMSIVDTPRTFGEKAIRVDYRFTRLSTKSSWIHLYTDIPVYGIPDYFEFDFKSDGQKHRAYIYAYDSEGDLFKNMITKYATVSASYDTLRALMRNFRNEDGAVLDHPLRIESLRVKLGYYSELDEINEGTVYFDNLRAVYPQVTSIIPLHQGRLPQRACLHPNYPNPFNPITTIAFETVQSGMVELVIYDLLGRKVETLLSQELNAGFHRAQWDATHHASGIYLVRLSTARGFTQARKLVLLK
jgi:hypothetical protein